MKNQSRLDELIELLHDLAPLTVLACVVNIVYNLCIESNTISFPLFAIGLVVLTLCVISNFKPNS